MKKVLRVIICALFIILLVGCTKKNNKNVNTVKNIKLQSLTLTIPKRFTKDKENTNDKAIYYSYTSKDGKESCFIGVFYVESSTSDLEELAKGNLYTSGEISVSDKTINNQKWKVAFAKEDDNHFSYSYATKFKKAYYLVSYNNMGNGEFCNSSYDNIINSLIFK